LQLLSADQLVGRMLGEYQIERLLGRGQLGAAYVAQQLSLGRTVMITMFNYPEESSAQELSQLTGRVAQERAALVKLAHPHIIPIYDVGEQSGSLYLATDFVKGASLGQVLKQQVRFTPRQTLDLLKQVASGLDYAHSKGIVHGLLSPSHVLMRNELTLQIAGFGLRTMLEMREGMQHTQPQSSPFSPNGAYLGNPAYVSPERVLGMLADARSDIYTLGVILFELLSGALPFSGADPVDIALKHVQHPVPSVHTLCPDVPEALDLVLGKMLECDPAKRYQRAGDSAVAFERALQVMEAAERSSTPLALRLAQEPQLTLPPTVNWFDEEVLPSIISGMVPAISPPSPTDTASHLGTPVLPSQSLLEASQLARTTRVLPQLGVQPPSDKHSAASLVGIDPFSWWSVTATKDPQPQPGTFANKPQRPPVRLAGRGRRHAARQDRRQVVKLIATGAAVAGLFAVGGISFDRFVQSLKQAQQVTNIPTSAPNTTTQGNTPTTGTTQAPQNSPTASQTQTPNATPTHSARSTPTAQPTPGSTTTAQPTPRPTPRPNPTPTPTPTPSHTGTVIGHTSQPTNSAASFTNPADGQASWLVHMSNGNFVAVEQACTHAGAPVRYNSSTGQFNCPAHGAIFNADGTNPQPPATTPLPSVHITVNADGTITSP